MEHKPVETLRDVAEVREFKQGFLSRRERLERWAELLERQPKRRLRSLGEIEFVPKDKRPELRSDESPITVAFEDPILRAAGLKGDTLGDAMEFFELSEGASHRLLCSCMNGPLNRMSACGANVLTGRTGHDVSVSGWSNASSIGSRTLRLANR